MLSSVLNPPEKGRHLTASSANPLLVWMFLGLAVASAYYVFVITLAGVLDFLAPVPYGLTFNSMLSHLLVGRFDVDPQTISDEGTLRHGLVYAYFGILPAVLRLPFVWLPNFASTDYSRLACVVAVAIMAGFKLLSVQTVWRVAGTRERLALPILFTIAILIGGPQIQFLRPSVYQEVLLWTGTLSAGFVYFVLRGYYSERGFSLSVLNSLALIAGLCLLTRVTMALGLYIAFGLLWLHLAWRSLRDPEGRSRTAGLARLVVPVVILLAFAAVTAYVNYERWDNPLTFAGSQGYIWATVNAPDRFLRAKEYGEFNLIRLGYNLIYYFFPIWVLRTVDGALLWSVFQHRTIDAVELPPSSFFLTDPLVFGLAAFCLVQLVRHKDALTRTIVVPVLAGLAVPIMLILIFISETFRYRMEFYPFVDLCAFIGFGILLARTAKPPARLFAIAAIGTVLASHAVWLLYALSKLGPASVVLGNMDVMSYYLSWFR
jgi:hypothetical protein